jgi:Ca2+-binding RTX toxin-like protein
MGRKRSQLLKLTISLALLGTLALAVPAFASAARILYANGHQLDSARLATFGGHTLVDPMDGNTPEEGFDACSDSEWATELARTDFDVLMVGEDGPGCLDTLSPATLTAIGNYVRAGHAYIQTGAHENEDDWMNAVFGFSTSNVSDTSSETLTGTLQPAATGTPFAGGPATLTDPSATELQAGTPGTTIYSGPEGVWVFTTPVGAGQMAFLAWDFCCADSASTADDWYRVLDRAIQQVTHPAVAPQPEGPTNTCQGQRVTILGTDGPDTLIGTPGRDVIVAGGGADKVNGLGGNDVICGDKGKDTLKGGAGNDKLQGNKSADRLIGNGGKDSCRGGLGKDTASSCESVKGL